MTYEEMLLTMLSIKDCPACGQYKYDAEVIGDITVQELTEATEPGHKLIRANVRCNGCYVSVPAAVLV